MIGKRVRAPSTWGTGEDIQGGYEGGELGAQREAVQQQGQSDLHDAGMHLAESYRLQQQARNARAGLQQHDDEQVRLDDAANRGIDPQRVQKRMGIAGNIGLAIAAGMGAFGAAITHTDNFALRIINKHIDDDIDAQKHEIEQAGKKAAAHRGLYAHKLALLGDPVAAEAAAKAENWQYAASKAKYEAGQSQDRILKARGNAMAAQFAMQAADYNQQVHRLVTTNGAAGINDKILARMQHIRDQSGGTVPVDQARQAATAEVLSAYGNTGVEGLYPKPGKQNPQSQKESAAAQDAIANIDKLLALRDKHGGGTLSIDDRNAAEAIAARTQERLVAALGKTNAQLLQRTQEMIPNNPLELKVAGAVGADPIGVRLRAARQMLQEELGRRGQGGGASESVDEDVRGLSEEEQ
jgi:hypothetical protein